jgi:molybdate transport system substrate-binding protein
MRSTSPFLGALLLLLAGLASTAGAAEVRVLSSNAMREVVLEAAPVFEKASGHKVSTEFVGSVDILKRLRAGEKSADIVMLQISSIDQLTAENLLLKGSRTDIARSLVGVAVRAGAPKPDISSGEALRRTLLDSKSIVVSSGPSGDYMLTLLAKMGIPRDRYRQLGVGVQTGQLVARGEAEICFQQVSELLPVKGIDFLGSLPPDVEHVTVFAGGVHSASPDPQAAKALLQFLASTGAAPILKAKGMDPAR